MNKTVIAAATMLVAIAAIQPSLGGDAKKPDGHDHSVMQAPKGANEAEALGVINAVDAAGRTLNITHEPVEALGWPKMTMDLPVTRRVDLSTVKTGEKVRFKLKQGRDKRFRIMAIEPAP